MDKRYFKCFKCGALTYTEDGGIPEICCTASMAVRTSGICGGAFSIEISEDEYFTTISRWKNHDTDFKYRGLWGGSF